ncbi:MAG TPA: GNAT family N-acetyltransferase [Puia sp.]|nr:GNAT family N-acetyltransferase [Puia sp.]
MPGSLKEENIRIVDYEPHHQQYFEQLNRAWIEKDFHLEPVDKFVLMEPEKAILNRGGAILMAYFNDEVAGTVGLKKVDYSTYELIKMTVSEKFRRKGIAEKLSKAAIEKAKSKGASRLILYSQTCLQPAIHLYKKLGFTEVPLEAGTYERCDIKMEMILEKITIREAGIEHATSIAAVGKRSFYDTFRPFFNNQDELRQYLDYTYDTEKIASSITKPNNVFFIALLDQKMIGFAKLKKQSPNQKISADRQVELQKIYVLKEYQGSGAGQALLQAVLQMVSKIQPQCIWLDVLIHNERAIRFYEKNGFEKYGKHFFTIGSQTLTYDIMILPVRSSFNQSPMQMISDENH